MKMFIFTLFPEVIENYINISIIKRAREKEIVDINVINFRDFSESKHKKVDDYPYGGGAGMVITPQPIVDALKSIEYKNKKVIYLSPKGKKFDQTIAQDLAKGSDLVLICGHYEGIDQRVIDKYVDMEISIGDFILSGGELAALTVVDSVTRLIPGAIKEDSLIEESYSNYLLEYSHYTRPQYFEDMEVPKILLSGNHQEIRKHRLEESIRITLTKRPDLIKKGIQNNKFDKETISLINKIKKILL